MIFHKLVFRYLRHGDDRDFYLLQARYTVRWLESAGVELGEGVTALDLGCGHGMMGGELASRGCRVVCADEIDCLPPERAGADLRIIDIERDDLWSLGHYDLVICSNVNYTQRSPKRADIFSTKSTSRLLKRSVRSMR